MNLSALHPSALARRIFHADDRRSMFALGSLLYLGFLFLPVLIPPMAKTGWLLPTLISLLPFLYLYVLAWRTSGAASERAALGIGALALLLLPFNPAAHTYVIYAVAALTASAQLKRALTLSALVLLAYTSVHCYLGYPLLMVAMTMLLVLAIGVANIMATAYGRKDAALRLSQEEVRQLARLAERERIGRDLHDLLGHTLSVIVLKAELANRLYERDPDAARREIAEVERVARETLGQVRRAVVGIRSAGLRAELANARLALDAVGVDLDYEIDRDGLPVELETAFALVLREAVTNIIRHAGAAHARISLQLTGGHWVLEIRDDGRHAGGKPGSGILGMHERMAALGGVVCIDSGARGTQVRASIPQDAAAATTAALVTP